MKKPNYSIIALLFVSTLLPACQEAAEDEVASDIDAALVGDWWETFHSYTGVEIDPTFRWTFDSDGTGQFYCSEQLAQDGCSTSEIFWFDWTVLTVGSMEFDQHPLESGTDYAAKHWTYTVSGNEVEMVNYDALDNETVLGLGRTAP